MILFARLRVPAASALEGRPAATIDAAGSRRVLAVADPGSEVARWDVPADETLDADEEVIVAATRAGLADLLRLAALPAGAARTISDLPERDGPLPRTAVGEAADAVRSGVGRVRDALPARRSR
jgi:hypothetical protein